MNKTTTYSLAHVDDEALIAGLAALVGDDRRTLAKILAHIAEVETRKLFATNAFSTLHEYCVEVFKMSGDVASKRIAAARLARQFPTILAAIADGRLHLANLALLAPHLTRDGGDELIAAAAHRTRNQLQLLLAERFPKPDAPTRLEPEPEQTTSPDCFSAPGQTPAPAAAPPARTEPLSPGRFKLQLTIEQQTHDKLLRAQALLRHRLPSGDLTQVVDRALDALLANLERERLGAAARPRRGKPRDGEGSPRSVARAVVRAVIARDGERCAFVSADGRRCAECGFLELDHIVPVARGGLATVANLRIACRLCRARHNRHYADRRIMPRSLHHPTVATLFDAA